MSQHLKMIPNLKIHNQSKCHYAQDNHFQYYPKYYQTSCLHVVTICKQCTTIIIKTKFNDGETPKSYLKLSRQSIFAAGLDIVGCSALISSPGISKIQKRVNENSNYENNE